MGIQVVQPGQINRYVAYNKEAVRLQNMLSMLVPDVTWNVHRWQMIQRNALTAKPYYELIHDDQLNGAMRRGRWVVEATLGPIVLVRHIDKDMKLDSIAAKIIAAMLRKLKRNLPGYKEDAQATEGTGS